MHLHELQSKLKTPPIFGRKRAVLISTGSYCPVHKGHLQNFDIAAKFLSEKCNIDPLVGYISPSCDLYVSNKLGDENIFYEHRYEMVKLACFEHNSLPNYIKVFPDPWEGLQPSFISFGEVREHFQMEMQKLFPRENIIVLYLSGADHFNRCRLYNSYGYVGIARNGYKIKGTNYPERNIYVCNDPEYDHLFSDTSSTAIRNRMKKGENINGLTYESVVQYINEYIL